MEKVADAMHSTCEWCKEHWREIALVLEVVVAIVCLFIPGLEEIGIGILAGMFIGSLCGAALGGLSGYAQYGVQGILPGVLQGAENGALIGGLCGGLGWAGALAGEAFGCSTLMTGIFSVSSKLSIGMMAFDLTALANDFQTRFKTDTGIDLGLIDPTIGGFISNLNHEAHNNPFYNALQVVTAATAAFSGGYVRTATCFVAGTLIATVDGLKAIESIKVGDLVLSANTETMQTDYKPVLETYIRNVDKLVHLTVNGEEIISTVDHPFYVNAQGFVNAVDLCIGSELVDSTGIILKVEQIFRESLHDETCDVYNFKVDEWHTYFVGDCGVLVHNANCNPAGSNSVREVESVQTLEDAHAMPLESRPNSVIQNYKEGNLITERYYGSDGKPYLDIDYTNHGNPKMHPIVPHEHDISFDTGHFSREKVGREIKK